ncbi:cytochrome P450 2D15-like [Latimeria chalumnae]|uniref:cytochrome P450 2D15-like n=1 Tax=Latimeria chalumnae TaxID=7897 RepID=UPI00313AF16A
MEFLPFSQSFLNFHSSLTLLALFCTVFLLIFDFIKRRKVWKSYPPGPWELPFVGSMFHVNLRSPHLSISKLRQTFGDVYSLQYAWRNVVVLNGYEVIKEALVKNAEAFADRPHLPLYEKLGYTENNKGIALAHYGRSWKEQRRFTLFTLRNFGLGKKSLEERIIEEAGFLTAAFQSQKGQPFNPHFKLNNAISNVICSLTFGARFDYDDQQFLNLLYVLEENRHLEGGLWGELVLAFPWLSHFPGPHQKIFTNYKKIMKWMKAIIEEHRVSREPAVKRDFIDAYLDEMQKEDSDSSFNEGNLIFTTLDMFLAGTETTTTTLRWALLYMVLYPDIQAKVHEEIDRVIGKDRDPTLKDQLEMPFTNAVIHEVQRSGDILPLGVLHMTCKDAEVMGYFIPKRTLIMTNLSSVLKDEKLWEKPHQFYPQNFLDADSKFVKHQAFLPFSLGRRVCLGEQLARMELFLFFTFLMQHLTFRVPQGIHKPKEDGELAFTLAPYPYKICVETR